MSIKSHLCLTSLINNCFFSARDLDNLFAAKTISAEQNCIALRPRSALSQNMTLNGGRKVMRMRQTARFDAERTAIATAEAEQKAAALKMKEVSERLKQLKAAQKKEGVKACGHRPVKTVSASIAVTDENNPFFVLPQHSQLHPSHVPLDPELEPLPFPSSSLPPPSSNNFVPFSFDATGWVPQFQ